MPVATLKVAALSCGLPCSVLPHHQPIDDSGRAVSLEELGLA